MGQQLSRHCVRVEVAEVELRRGRSVSVQVLGWKEGVDLRVKFPVGVRVFALQQPSTQNPDYRYLTSRCFIFDCTHTPCRILVNALHEMKQRGFGNIKILH